MRPVTGYQRGMQFFMGHTFVPDGTSAGGRGLGAAWTTGAGITLSHATPGTAFDTQWKRTVYSNSGGGGTGDQELGPRQSAASEYCYWPGSARYTGGWYMSSIFRLESWNNDAGRLFVGFTGDTAAICTNDVVPKNTWGLWHDTGDAQDKLSIVTRDNGVGAAVKTQITQHTGGGIGGVHEVSGLLATGVTLMFECWHFPFGLSQVNVNYRLAYFDTSMGADAVPKPLNRVKKVVYGELGNLTNTKFMAPQVQMSNGADTTAGHFSIGVANIYCAPWAGEMD